MSHRNGNASYGVGLTSDVSVELGDFVLVDFRQLWFDESFGVDQVLLEERLLDNVEVLLVHSVVRKDHLIQSRLNTTKS